MSDSDRPKPKRPAGPLPPPRPKRVDISPPSPASGTGTLPSTLSGPPRVSAQPPAPGAPDARRDRPPPPARPSKGPLPAGPPLPAAIPSRPGLLGATAAGRPRTNPDRGPKPPRPLPSRLGTPEKKASLPRPPAAPRPEPPRPLPVSERTAPQSETAEPKAAGPRWRRFPSDSEAKVDVPAAPAPDTVDAPSPSSRPDEEEPTAAVPRDVWALSNASFEDETMPGFSVTDEQLVEESISSLPVTLRPPPDAPLPEELLRRSESPDNPPPDLQASELSEDQAEEAEWHTRPEPEDGARPPDVESEADRVADEDRAATAEPRPESGEPAEIEELAWDDLAPSDQPEDEVAEPRTRPGAEPSSEPAAEKLLAETAPAAEQDGKEPTVADESPSGDASTEAPQAAPGKPEPPVSDALLPSEEAATGGEDAEQELSKASDEPATAVAADELAMLAQAVRGEIAAEHAVGEGLAAPEPEPGSERPARAEVEQPPESVEPRGAHAQVEPLAPAPTDAEGLCAASLLSRRQMLEHFSDRATWLEQEAQTCEDPKAKARTLVVASELWAMVGDASRAREVAERAAAGAGSGALAHRQARWLAAVEHDWAAVATALDSEIRSSPNPESRCHAANLLAHLQRHVLGDAEGGMVRRLDLAIRALPEDARAYVTKLAGLLAHSPDPPRMRLQEGRGLYRLAQALEQVGRLRGSSAAANQPPETPTAAIPYVRRALLAGNRERAAAGLDVLGKIEELRHGANFLAACLLAQERSTRTESIARLKALLAERPSRAARLALACRAVEQGDVQALEAAFEGDERHDFSTTDRIALAILTGASDDQLRPWIVAIKSEPALRPLVDGTRAATAAPTALPEPTVGDDATRAELRIGRTLARCAADGDLVQAISAYRDSHPGDPLPIVLLLEMAVRQNAPERVAEHLRAWDAGGPLEGDPTSRALASATMYGLAERVAERLSAYRDALGTDPGCEPAARALLSEATAAEGADVLTTLADAVGAGTRAALLLVEAALRRGPRDPQFEPLLRRSVEADPSCPLACRVGEQAARLRGDAEGLASWLSLARAGAVDPFEMGLYAVREALLTVEHDAARGSNLLQEALDVRPNDVTLRQLVERVSTGSGIERGQWREEVAEDADLTSKAALLMEAALEYERAGETVAALRTAQAAAATGLSEFAEVVAERLESSGPTANLLVARVLEEAKKSQDAPHRAELHRRIARIEQARGERASALEHYAAILECLDDDLVALRRLEHAHISDGRASDLEPIASKLAGLLERNEANAHAHLAARLRSQREGWDAARPLVEIAFRLQPPPLWALRAMAAHARISNDDERSLEVVEILGSHSLHAVDAATLSLRAAECAARLGRLDVARAAIDRAVDLVPDHLVALVTRAEILESLGQHAEAAETLEAVAGASSIDSHRQQALYRAAITWLEKVNDADRGRAALERANEIDEVYEPVFERLRALYCERGDKAALLRLVQRRLAQCKSPDERFGLEVLRGRTLAEVGDLAGARRALTTALQARPQDPQALAAMGEVCEREQDWSGAEAAWLKLAPALQDVAEAGTLFGKLGDLYADRLDRLSDAEHAYEEALDRTPDNGPVAERLVKVHARLGRTNKAVALQMKLISSAENPDQQRDRTLELARVYEQLIGDKREAENVLERARRTWHRDPHVLRAFAEFYRGSGEEAALEVLLNRTANEARRALNTGRFESVFFEMLAVVSEIRGEQDASQLARAALGAVNGEPTALEGAGLAALNPEIDDLIAPEHFSLPLRALLRKTGNALDTAFPADLDALGATRPNSSWPEELDAIRDAATHVLGEPPLIWVSDTVGKVCIPLSSSPPQLLVGTEVLASPDERVVMFLLVRALKVLQVRAAPLARTAPGELWPMLAAYLSALAPSFDPEGVDAEQHARMRDEIKATLPPVLDDDVSSLALEVGTLLANRAGQLAAFISQMGNRAGLLAIGCPTTALAAIATATTDLGSIPPQPAARLRWIVRSSDARDLVVFGTSEAYARARRQLELLT